MDLNAFDHRHQADLFAEAQRAPGSGEAA